MLGRDAAAAIAHARMRTACPATSDDSVIVPPSGVCRSALAARFCSACSRRSGSPSTILRAGADLESRARCRGARSRARAAPARDRRATAPTRARVSDGPAAAFEPAPDRADRRSMRSSRCVSSSMMREIALARRGVELELVHRQRLDVAAHRGERRHQLVRDVGQQLPARAIRCLERLARGWSSSSAMRLNDRATAATSSPPASGRARGQIARAEPLGRRPARACNRRRAGPNTNSAMSVMPTASTPPATTAIVGPSSLQRCAKTGRAGQHGDAADEVRRQRGSARLPMPLRRQRHRAGRRPAPAVASAVSARAARSRGGCPLRAVSTSIASRSSSGYRRGSRATRPSRITTTNGWKTWAELLAHVLRQIERGIGGQRGRRHPTRRSRRDGAASAPESSPPSGRPVQTKSALCAASISARNAKSPSAMRQYRLRYQRLGGQARHRPPCSPSPTR